MYFTPTVQFKWFNSFFRVSGISNIPLPTAPRRFDDLLVKKDDENVFHLCVKIQFSNEARFIEEDSVSSLISFVDSITRRRVDSEVFIENRFPQMTQNPRVD